MTPARARDPVCAASVHVRKRQASDLEPEPRGGCERALGYTMTIAGVVMLVLGLGVLGWLAWCVLKYGSSVFSDLAGGLVLIAIAAVGAVPVGLGLCIGGRLLARDRRAGLM